MVASLIILYLVHKLMQRRWERRPNPYNLSRTYRDRSGF